MASTITLLNTRDWSLPFVRYMPVTIGVGNEPAITSANVVKQTILGAPFVWRWNRAVNSTITTTANTQDYTASIPDFGFFEKATVTDAASKVTELDWKQVLSTETTVLPDRPTFISTQSDDNAGNITFRLMPVPDAAYTLTIIYQKQPTLFTSLSSTWAPIPDYMAYIFNRGFLAFTMENSDDPRFSIEHQRWLASLLSAAEGLTEMEKNIFLGNVLSTNSQTLAAQLRTQQGTQGRGT